MNDTVPVVETKQTFAILDDRGRRWTAEMRFKLVRNFGSDFQSSPVLAGRTTVPATCQSGLLIEELRRIATKFAGNLQQQLADPEAIAQIQRRIDDEEQLRQEWEERWAALAKAVESMFRPVADANPAEKSTETEA